MCIVYLQTEGLLPNLQDPTRVQRAGRTGNYAYVNWGKPTGTQLALEFADRLHADDAWRPDATAATRSLGEVIAGFFDFWSCALSGMGEGASQRERKACEKHAGVDARLQAFSILKGGCITRARPVDEEGKERNAAELLKYREAWKRARGGAGESDEVGDAQEGPEAVVGAEEADLTAQLASAQAAPEKLEEDPAVLDVNGDEQIGQHAKPASQAGSTLPTKPKTNGSRRRNDPQDILPDPPTIDGQPYHWCRAGLIIQDPFLHEKNCARGVEMRMVARLAEVGVLVDGRSALTEICHANQEFERSHAILQAQADAELEDYEMLLENVSPPLSKAAKRRAQQLNGGRSQQRADQAKREGHAPANAQAKVHLAPPIGNGHQGRPQQPVGTGPNTGPNQRRRGAHPSNNGSRKVMQTQ